jgi:uncharacterized pyridoxal phosphate-dependent enzyme
MHASLEKFNFAIFPYTAKDNFEVDPRRASMRRVVNAAGKMTYLGASTLSTGVIAAMAEAARHPVEVEALTDEVGDAIATAVGADAARPTASAAAGIVIAVAACLTGADPARVDLLPEIAGGRDEVVLQAGHLVDFGARIEQLARIAGARPRVVGAVNRTHRHQLDIALGERAAAVLHVVSHHAADAGSLPLETVVEAAHGYGISVIVDAAAEDDPARCLRTGVDLAVFSGHKAFGAPTSGFICGRSDLVHACAVQERGIGRAMKVGKETLAGLGQAMREWGERDPARERARLEARVVALRTALAGLEPRARLGIRHDATRGIPRLAVEVSDRALLERMVAALRDAAPAVFTRDHGLPLGVVEFDPRELDDDDIPLIRDRLTRVP